jgi:membrane-associated phospholipid phosphatase
MSANHADTGRPDANPRAIAVAAGLLVLSAMASAVSSTLIAAYFPDRPTPRDLLFEVLPFLDAAQYLTDIVLITALALLFGHAVTKARDQTPNMLAVFALMYLIRAVLMLLTPLASAHGNGVLFGLIPLVQNGMFPSGHAAAALLCYLLVDEQRAPHLRRALLWLALAESLTLLLAHGHYSIDIAGAWLLSYFVYHEWYDGSLFRPLKNLLHGWTPIG